MANTKLSQAAPGTVVKTNYNGVPTNFVVLHQGKPSPIYDDSFNGGTIMRFESIPENYQWTTTGTNDYAASSVQAHIQGYVQYFDPGIQSNIKTVKIPYRPGTGYSPTVNSGANGLECQMYLLAAIEMGGTDGNTPADGALLDYYLSGATAEANAKRVANYNGSPMRYNTRSPFVNNPSAAAGIWEVLNSGSLTSIHTGNNNGALPAFVLDANTLYVDSDGFLTADPGAGQMFIPSTELEQGVEYYFRIFPRNHQNQFQTGIDGSQLHIVVQDGNEAEPDDSIPTEITPSYTGNSQIFGDGTKGYIECYDSGVLTFNTDVTVDIFLVGGGAGTFAALNQAWSSPGGGGGYTATFKSIRFSKGEEIAVTIGAGGQDADGGSTSVGSYTAEGGKRGIRYSFSFKGGNGGCGGGSGGSGPGQSGGANGSNGSGYSSDYTGGIGQGSTTCEFANTQLRLFSGGGGGGGGYSASIVSTGGKGGEGGGGDGGAGNAIGAPGQPNTGGGAGGNGGNYKNATAAGGSGIAIIRWGDWTTTGGAN